MPQAILPLFSEDMTIVSDLVAYRKKDDKVFYFLGQFILYQHHIKDENSFKYICCILMENGQARQSELIRAFKVSKSKLARAQKIYKEQGIAGLFKKKKRRGSTVLKKSIVNKIEKLLIDKKSIPEISKQLNIKADTIRKGIRNGKIKKNEEQEVSEEKPTIEVKAKSDRTKIDTAAPMGRGATRTSGRVAASRGRVELKSIPIQFESNKDVSKAGVLLALPSLLCNGLLKNVEKIFEIPKGFYSILSIFMLLAFGILMRIKSIEAFKTTCPGEFGKILGLDRIPEIKTIREKINIISEYKNVNNWGIELSKDWMEKSKIEEDSEVYYVDGHVKEYSGSLAKLPKRYKAQKKLCVSGITEYWVNDKKGQPYFYISKIIDDGLIKSLKNEIVPRLLKDVPNQPTEKELSENLKQYRFGLVFDREGYSPKMMKTLWKNYRICCYTYKKYVKDKWSEDDFKEYKIITKNGDKIKMKLSEKTYEHKDTKLKIREIRKLLESGHQTSIITTDYINKKEVIALRMFSRWCQENFFKYMAENFGIDSLIAHSLEELSEPRKVKNPVFNDIKYQINKKSQKLLNIKKDFSDTILPDFNEEDKNSELESKKMQLFEEIKALEYELEELKKEKKNTPTHIDVSELPEHKRYTGLAREKKHFLDLIKMIAYRAETSMSNILGEYLKKPEESRIILKQIFTADADLRIDEENKVLEVSIHNFSNERTDKAVQNLMDVLNETETIFPDTNLRVFYRMVSY